MNKNVKFLRLLTLVLVALISTFVVSNDIFAEQYINVDNADDFKTAVENGDSVKLNSDIELSEIVTITKGNVIIDLNGKVLSYVTDVAGEAMIKNNGGLTIKDSTDKADGKILFTYVGTPDSNYGKGNYTISNSGTLVLDNGIVENATARMSHACYAIDNNANGRVSSLTINGGKVINTNNYAIRQITSANDNIVTVNGGIVTGTRAIWIQLAGSDTEVKPNVTLNVNGGSLIGTGESSTYKLAVYSYNYGNSLENVKINIAGGVLDGDLALSGGKNKTVAEDVNITDGKITNVYSYAAYELHRIAISGGTFGSDVSWYVTDGSFMRQDGLDYIVEKIKTTPTVDTIDPEEEKIVKEVTVGVAKNEEVEDILLDSLAKDKEAADIVEQAGVSVNIAVEVDKIDEKAASEEVKEAISAIKEKAGNATIAHFFDVTVAVKNAITNDKITTIPSLSKEIELLILLPEDLKNNDKNVNREYFVVREHDGEIKVIDAKLSEDGKYLVFKSDKFSTYALVYEDVVKVVENPQTYDGISTYMVLGAISLIGLAIISLYIKNKKIFN